MTQTNRLLSDEEALQLVKDTLDESFPSTPPASSMVQETTDLLVDIPMFMVENLDEFLTLLEERLGTGWGEIVGKDLLDDVEYFSKVENIINKIQNYMDFLDDDLIFADCIGPTEEALETVSTQNFYSFESKMFIEAIQSIQKNRMEMLSAQDRMLEACVSANTSAAHLNQIFLGHNYFAEEIKEGELIRGATNILMSMHQILAEFEMSELMSLEGHSKGFSLEFDNPLEVKFLHDLEPTSSMLSVVISKLLEKVYSDYSERQQTKIGEIADDIQMIFSMCNDVVAYSGGSINQVVKKF